MVVAATIDDISQLEAESVPARPQAGKLTAWWLHPATLFILVALGTLLPALLMSSEAYAHYDTPKYLSADSFKFALIACLAVVCGVYAGMHTGSDPRPISTRMRRAILPWFYLSAGLTLFGYTVWTANGLRHGLSLEHVSRLVNSPDAESAEELKFEVLRTIPGVTTCTQFGLIGVLLGAVVGRRLNRWVVPLIVAIIGLAGVRMLLFSERLALIEVVVALGLVWLRTSVLSRPSTPSMQRALSVFPVIGFVTLIVLFGAAEYLRSWKYYKHEMSSIVDFTLIRLFGYYSTSHNNGAMSWECSDAMPLPYHTMTWYWHFPLLSKTPLSYVNLSGIEPTGAYTAFLSRYGNPEFNNPGGLFSPTLDFGIAGGIICWLVFGFLAGRLYRSYLAGALSGLLLYPFFVITILEVPRFIYLCTVRPIAPIALTVLILYCVARRQGITHGYTS